MAEEGGRWHPGGSGLEWVGLEGREQSSFSPWVVVSPFVPARGTTPLSTCWELGGSEQQCEMGKCPEHCTLPSTFSTF